MTPLPIPIPTTTRPLPFRTGRKDQSESVNTIVEQMSSNNLHSDQAGLESLFAKAPARIVVEPDTPAAPITVRLTGDAATDPRLLADAYALRDAQQLRVGHSVMVIVWNP